MAQFLGRATIRANGTVIETNKGASLNVGGIRRNPIVTGQTFGYAEESVHATIECETSLGAGMQTLDQCLQELIRRNLITPAEARLNAKQGEMFA